MLSAAVLYSRAVPNELIHEVLPVGLLQCNCSILGDPDTGEAIVVDPGDEIEYVIDILKQKKLRVRAILSTHAHIDHVGGLARLQEVTGAPVLMHPDDYPLYQRMDMQAQWLHVAPPALAKIDSELNEGDTISWGGWQASVLHTPGHTPGSVSLYIPLHRASASPAVPGTSPDISGASQEQRGEKRPGYTGWLLAGDTLFAGSIGRTDLWGGDLRTIMSSLHEKLMALPDATRVYPGHGPITSIGEERNSNPFLRRKS